MGTNLYKFKHLDNNSENNSEKVIFISIFKTFLSYNFLTFFFKPKNFVNLIKKNISYR